jgi:hypothetical protein
VLKLICGSWLFLVSAAAQQPKLMLPFGPVTRLLSPDGTQALTLVPVQPGSKGSPELRIANVRTGESAMLLSIGGTVEAQWSPDGAAFYVNDRFASDSMLSYIYDALTHKRMEIAVRIQDHDPGSKRFAHAHTYFKVEQWDGSQAVMVKLFGHTDIAPVVCFELRYRVDREGAVRKLSERVSPVTAKGCAA